MNIFFSPHQDDELLTMGIACLSLANDQEKQVVLCTDGSGSCVKSILRNLHRCDKHNGLHYYFLTNDSFVKARDTEFFESCLALGYSSENIHIPSSRALDGQFTKEMAKELMLKRLSCVKSDSEIIVHTLLPLGEKQHSDHTNLGKAAIELYQENVIDKLYLYVEPYCLDIFYKKFKNISLEEIECQEQGQLEYLKKAIHSYCKWEPMKKRYAVGYHSVSDLFVEFMQNPRSYRIEFCSDLVLYEEIVL